MFKNGLPLRWPLLDFLVLASVQHDLVRMSGGHARVSFGPVVRNCVSEDVAGSVESSRSDRTGRRVESYLPWENKSLRKSIERGEFTSQPSTRILVPEVNGAIRTLGPVSTWE